MMNTLWKTAPMMALALSALPAVAAEPAQNPPEARITFADQRGINNWRAEGRDTVYLQDRFRSWYRATLMMPSPDLPFAQVIGIDAGPVGTLDRFGAIYIDGRRYPIQSLVKIDGPPPAKARKKAHRAS